MAGVDADLIARLAACRQRGRLARGIGARVQLTIEDGVADAHGAQRGGIGWRRCLPGLRHQPGLLLQPRMDLCDGRGAGRIVTHDAHIYVV
ncbi:hypothetical protein [Xanthomonas oryzae]|uniref:hypothetical protein n=1 Tax=Xanthomonas oryzae TaxID=347 RepID=UPI0013141065|nr:hypothetical protein [Xanthomonas oryzae]